MKNLQLITGLIFSLLAFSSTSDVAKTTKSMITPPQFMNDVLTHIQATYPNAWLSDLVVNDENIAVEIQHPNNTETYLSVDIFPEQVLIGVLEEANREIPFDLGGFHFDFAPDQMSAIQAFFINHQQTGIAE